MTLSDTQSRSRVVVLYWAHTSDVHGSIFSYDYLKNRPTLGGLPSVYSYVNSLRKAHPGRVILSDGGDVLQGQPVSYYYNFINTSSPHVVASAMNEMDYDCGTIGNHDIETGHEVYDRWIRESKHPIVAANIIDERTGQTYLPPYHIIEREGIRIAVLGMITPGIPNWLPRILWSNLQFQDMLTCARKWVPYIREKEKPDLLVGLFHSGYDGGMIFPDYRENATEQVAREVPGFDLICFGHDHNPRISRVVNTDGDTVLCMGTQDAASKIAQARIRLKIQDGKIVSKNIWAETIPMVESQSPDAMAFEAMLTEERQEVARWVKLPLGTLTQDVMERDAFFGPSTFMSLIHDMQLSLAGADISFAAPISFDSHISKGKLTVRDMFSLYKYENFLYTMQLTGQEIKDYLEMTYALWTNQMTSPDDHILLFDHDNPQSRRLGLKNLSYNMDSAAGIIYEVDVTKPEGRKINIHQLTDGRPFSLDKTYKVAVNSYRGNGGGELLTKGAHIPHAELEKRILSTTDKDLRYFLMLRIINNGSIDIYKMDNWRFVPEAWTLPALQRDRQLLFPED
ncbi:MAG: bifunctional metallophosphatase/5'-nucleotidase [Bacteroidaceae bacterium]|nr:bifunctional metallophosphatase/5'-nucleotidase [Bacteroidaceae bacterium]